MKRMKFASLFLALSTISSCKTTDLQTSSQLGGLMGEVAGLAIDGEDGAALGRRYGELFGQIVYHLNQQERQQEYFAASQSLSTGVDAYTGQYPGIVWQSQSRPNLWASTQHLGFHRRGVQTCASYRTVGMLYGGPSPTPIRTNPTVACQ